MHAVRHGDRVKRQQPERSAVEILGVGKETRGWLGHLGSERVVGCLMRGNLKVANELELSALLRSEG